MRKSYIIFFIIFSFLFNIKDSFANTKKIYPYKKIPFKGYKGTLASFYKNSNTILFLDNDNNLVFYNITTGKTYKKELIKKGYIIQYPQISPNYRYIIFAGYEGYFIGTHEIDSDKYFFMIYDLENNTYKKILKNKDIVMWDSSFSNDSNYFLLRVADDVYVYNLKTKKVQSIFKKIFDYYAEPSYVSCCSENNENFITMGKGGTVLRNLKNNKITKDIIYNLGTINNSPRFSYNGKYILNGNINNSKNLKDIINFTKDFKNCSFLCNDCFSSKDSNFILCNFYAYKELCKNYQNSNGLFIYSIKEKKQIAYLINENNDLDTTDRNNIQYSPDDKYVLVKGKNYITIWKIK
ncbi:MAG: hypothetical protein U0457_19895 [Candidatus Sericytochromatia bacterium]